MRDKSTSRRHNLWERRRPLTTLAATGLAVSMAVTGTGIISAAPAQASQAPIVVLVDSLRLPMVKAYEKANPSVKLDVELGDAGANGDGSIESKVALANRVGHGWRTSSFPPRQTTSKSWAPRRSISRPCSTRGSSRARSSTITRPVR